MKELFVKSITLDRNTAGKVAKKLKKFIRKPFSYEVAGVLTDEQYELIASRGLQSLNQKIYSDEGVGISLLQDKSSGLLRPGMKLISLKISSDARPIYFHHGDILYFSPGQIHIKTFESLKQKKEDSCFVKYFSAVSQYYCFPRKLKHLCCLKEAFNDYCDLLALCYGSNYV